MESGWFTLAKQQFEHAIQLDPDYYMAHIGWILSHDQLGYGMSPNDREIYRTKLNEFNTRPDLDVRLSYQDQQVFEAVRQLLNGADLNDGLAELKKVFDNDRTTDTYYIGNTIRGTALLLLSDSHETLESIAKREKKVFPLQLLMNNLNPYKKGKDRITAASQLAATSAVSVYNKLEISGPWQITADSVDISQYYGQWREGG